MIFQCEHWTGEKGLGRDGKLWMVLYANDNV